MCYQPVIIGYDKLNKPIKASCRKCIECRQTRANEWSLRCSMEMKDHEKNCFITMTYRENPTVLVKKDLQNFIKRLRKDLVSKFGKDFKIKYFSAGEYGDKMLRPHFHMIIFGYDFEDKIYAGETRSGKPFFFSKKLQDIWKHGLCTVQEANANTARYIALYHMKDKANGLPPYLWDYPEFNTMSQGLGVKRILKKIDTYLLTDEIFLEGFAYKVPNIVLEKVKGKYDIEEIKRKRFKLVSKEELETRKRIQIKKKRFTKQKEL